MAPGISGCKNKWRRPGYLMRDEHCRSLLEKRILRNTRRKAEETEIAVSMSEGLLKPLGKPAMNGHKFFCASEIIELAEDRNWLDKATRTIAERWQELKSGSWFQILASQSRQLVRFCPCLRIGGTHTARETGLFELCRNQTIPSYFQNARALESNSRPAPETAQ